MKFTYAALGAMLMVGVVLVAHEALGPTPVVAPAPPAPLRAPVTVLTTPPGPPMAQGRNPDSGQVVPIACVTCHATRTPNPANAGTQDLDLFHQGLQVRHGDNTCLSCHNAADYGTLHRADGRSVAFTDVITLCGQCHGPQLRDFRHGAHGGMNGAWDATRGDRQRQTCTACHDPHVPKYQGAHPALPPRDRFLETHHE